MASLPFLDDSTKELTSGTCAPRTIRLGEATVRAQSQAMTVSSRPTWDLKSARSPAAASVTSTFG